MGAPRALLVDIDGVLVVSWEPLPGAVEAVGALAAAGVPMRFLTNTTSRTRAEITAALHGAGFPVGAEDVLTVTSATAAYLRREHPGARCLLLSSGDATADLDGIELVDPAARDVDVVVLGGAGPEFTYPALNHALECLLAGAAFVAMHRNLLWRTRTGMQLDTGAYVAGLEQASGVSATVIGKPAPALFEAGLSSLGLRAHEAAMVGDDLDTDVRAAQRLGITGVQVRTGKFRPAQLDAGGAPDVLLGSFAEVPGWLGLSSSGPSAER
ncbi:HAD-IIA family hydrolase [Actinotalea sp.]|uniref:HAD-IIA family hydrolase n=1 Tax=Actinotalea sp. TaxID=1872145 RepID=UPI003568E8F2